jgi:hypothetical protein
MTLDATEIYLGLGLAACVFVLIGRPFARRKTRARLDPGASVLDDRNASLLDTIIARQSPASSGPIRAPARSEPDAYRPVRSGPQLSVLEGHLRNAVLDAPARERLVADAMRATGGNRAAAIGKVLRDLHDEDKRWS